MQPSPRTPSESARAVAVDARRVHRHEKRGHALARALPGVVHEDDGH